MYVVSKKSKYPIIIVAAPISLVTMVVPSYLHSGQ